jgi:Dyp-type peroxidase family
MPLPLSKRNDPLTAADLKTYKRALGNLQGNILKGHGRDHTAHIFLEFHKGKQNKVKKWLRDLAEQVTSMATQLKEQQDYRDYNLPGKLITCVYLTAAGYTYLGCGIGKFNSTFKAGMKESRAKLGDPRIEKWDRGFRGTIHAMILLADDSDAYVGREAHKMLDQVRDKLARISAVELGAAQRNADNNVIEHFGYADGLSQPLMIAADVEKALKKEHIKNFVGGWDPSAGPKLVLVQDPHGGKDAYGSYFVFRKLEQDVFGFKQREKELAGRLGLIGANGERAGATAVGRFEDGNPVAMDNDDELPTNRMIRNNFNYDDDPLGTKCPLHSHIRKVNPRGSTGKKTKERQGRIARVGITYGVRTDQSFEDEEVLPREGVGLLFMCYQADIKRQFEHMQQMMANRSSFPKPKIGIDPIIGQGSKGAQRWPSDWGNPDPDTKKPFHFSGFVTMKGGEYFFAPSIPFLKGLK